MTCIIGLIEKEKVYIGGDSAGVGGLHLTLRDDPKVFKNGPFLIGFTTSFRMGQLLMYAFKPPKQKVKDDYEFMVTKFVDAVRKCWKKGGYLNKKNEVEKGGTFLIAYKEKLYCMDSDLQIGIASAGYDAVGCGYDLALGAMSATEDAHLEPEDRITKALEAAAKFSAGVSAPFIIKHI